MEDYQITGTSLYYEEYEDDNVWDIDDEGIINIPGKKIIMQGDTASRYIPFRIKRYRDGIDLSEKKFQIIYNTDDGRADSPACINTYMNDEYIRTAWLIDPNVTQSACILSFQVFATGMNENEDPYNYHSQIKTLEVLPSLDKDIVISEKPQLYTDLMNYVNGVLDGSTGTIYAKLSRNLAVMEARISEIAATAGTNTADTEIGDARVRLNGTAATCLGDEVRAKADGYIYEDGKFYLTSGGIVITEGIEFKTDLTNYLTKDEILAIFQDGSLIADVVENDTGFTVVRSDGTEFDVITKGGLSFDSGYHDDNGYVHLTKDGEDIPDFTPFLVKGVGGGSDTGSKLKLSMYTASTFSVLDTAGTALIKGNFSSTDAETGVETGAGTLTISVGGVIRENKSVAQGEFEVDVFKYLNMGTNTVKLVMTDSYGSSVTRNYTIVKESFTFEWSLGETLKNSGTLSFYFTMTGSGDKTAYILVDGEVYSSQVISTSGRRVTVSIPNLTHGDHLIEAYGEMTVSGAILESNRKACAVAQVSAAAVTPIVAVNWPSGDITQYTTINIPHIVVDPMSNPASVSYLVNGVVYATESHAQSEYSWDYRPATAGTYTLGIMCGDVLEEKEYTVLSLGSDVQEVTDGLEVKVEPAIMTSLSGWQYGNYSFTLSDGFDEVNGGLKTDAEGVHCIKVIKGDRLTLNYKLFGDDAKKKGKQFKIVYTIENSTKLNAEAISCQADGIGFVVRANDVQLFAEQTSINMDTCEGMKTEMDFNIQMDTEERLMSLWESVSTFQYGQYATSENFTQSNSVGITFGSDECDVILYLFRAYNRELTSEELKANFAADGKNGDEIVARHNRNQIYDTTGRIDLTAVAALNPNLHVWVWHSERMSLGKKDYVNGYLSQVYTAGGAKHNWIAYMTVQNVQGTSSVEHAATAGGNQDFDFSNGLTLEDGTIMQGYSMSDTAKPVMKLTWKKNIASQNHITNSAVSEWYNRHQTSARQARIDDEGIRDCMESKMCVVFFHNTGSSAVQIGPDTVQADETSFYGLGNICNSKDNVEAFDYWPIVIEVRNNTEPQVRFKSNDLTDFATSFEFRHLDTSVYTEAEAIALFQEMVDFVYACDYTAATNTALSQVVSFNGQAFSVDSPAYRKAKWKAEAANHFDMESIYFHQNFTLHYLGRDSRAKNMFWGYNPETGLWDLRFAWDMDTFLGTNNEGHQDIQPGHLDTDTVGTKDVFNAADSALFSNNREVLFEELKANYLKCESDGAWDVDKFADYCDEMQSYACEALWIEDLEHNNIRTLTNLGTNSYLPRAVGKERLRRRKFLKLQGAFINSYYVSTTATANSATFRGYTPSQWAGVEPAGVLHITPYCNLFINTHIGSTDQQVRGYAGEEVEVVLPGEWNDSEGYIRSPEWIQSLGDLAPLYIGDCNLSPMIRLTRAEIGSSVDGYYNTNFETASFQNCKSLEYVNLGGLTNTEQAYDFSPNLMLKEIYTKGSGVTGLTFAKNGRLETARINAVASLALSGLRNLSTFEMESYDNLTSLTIENCPAIDSYAMAKAATKLARVRLLDINWSVPVSAYDVLMRLDGIHGIDDEGYTDETGGVLTGNVYFNSISETKYDAIVEAIPTVTFTYGEKLEECTVTFQNEDGTVLYVGKTEQGGSMQDPIAAGLIDVPTKESTVEKGYTYYKWDKSLDYIVGDTVVTATYVEYDMVYTVVFTDKDGTELESHTAKAYESVRYEGEDLYQAGYVWTGWDQDTSSVVSNMTVKAVYIYPTLPSEVKDVTAYDFAYSDDPNDSSAYTFGELYAICKTGQTETYLPTLSRIKIVYNTDLITDEYSILELGTTGYYELSDGTGATNADWIAVGLLNTNRRMNATNTNVGGYGATELAAWLENDYWNCLDARWRQFFVKRKVPYNEGNQSTSIATFDCHVSIPSFVMMGGYLDSVPYKNEVYSGAKLITWPQFTDNNSRIGKHFNGEGSADTTWLLSAWAGGSVAFGNINGGGPFYTYNAPPPTACACASHLKISKHLPRLSGRIRLSQELKQAAVQHRRKAVENFETNVHKSDIMAT